jgi:cytochrome b6-f complex iron-sulfur subunit
MNMNFNRRGVLRTMFASALGVGLAGVGAVAALWATIVARFLTPNVANQPQRTFNAGLPADYAEGCVETKYGQTHGVWIVRRESQLFALRTTCTHLGCITLWQESEQRFRCPCHGSAFTKEGVPVEGPAPRHLERCAIRIADDGQIEIDTSRTFREERGEWNRPESFVEV